MHRVKHLIRKEFLQLLRDPKMLGPVVIAPVLQLILFGYAATTDIRQVTTVVVDHDQTQQSRAFLDSFAASGYFRFRYASTDDRVIARYLDSGAAPLAIEVPYGFSRCLKKGAPAEAQLIVDGTDSNTAGIVMSYATGVVQRFSGEILRTRADRLRIRVPRLPQIDNRLRAWYNPELKSVDFMVPGVIAMILVVVSLMLTSLAVVREREIGTLEQLIVTPIRPFELMLGKLIPFAILGFVNVLFIVAAARLWFQVSVAGSVVLLFALTSLFLMANLGVGLFVSTISRTQQQAMMASFFIMQPSILLSGLFLPIENMPRWIQLITYLIPLRYFVTIIRGLYLKGAGIAELWQPSAVLVVFGISLLSLGAWRFSKRLE